MPNNTLNIGDITVNTRCIVLRSLGVYVLGQGAGVGVYSAGGEGEQIHINKLDKFREC